MPPAPAGGSRPPEGGTSRARQRIGHLDAVECRLWLVAVAALVLDLWLTYRGLQLGLIEGNPVLAAGIELMGLRALGLAKIAAVGVGVVCRLVWPAHALAIPLGLAVPWLLAAAMNTVRIVPLVV